MADDSLIGVTLGSWRLLRSLGQGAFGSVFEAEHVNIAGRRGAVKVLRLHLSAQDAIKRRFLNEASAASRAEHENIVQIFDGGITPDGICYSVMEILTGNPLSALLADGPIGPERTINIGVQVAGALQATHELQIVHRDLKPDNIFIIKRKGNAEFVKVLDFGVAKLQGELRTDVTSPGAVVGTPAYMSPEQWNSLPDIDGRADVYALGAVLYRCLTGRPPFECTSTIEWIKAHLQQPVPDPAQFAPVPPELSRIVFKMLAKRRDERHQTMADVLRELEALQGDRPQRPSLEISILSAVPPEPEPTYEEQADLSALPTVMATAPERPDTPTAVGKTQGSATGKFGPIEGESHPRGELQAEGERSGVRQRRSRAPLYAALGAVGLAIAGGVGWMAAAPSSTEKAAVSPVAEPPKEARLGSLYLEIDKALRARAWDAALAKCDAALALAPGEAAVTEKRNLAEAEKKHAGAFGRYEAAVKARDFENAMALSSAIPKGSVYRESVEKMYPEVSSGYIQGRIDKANALPQERCDEATELAHSVLALDPVHAGAKLVIKRCTVAAAAPPPAKVVRRKGGLIKPSFQPPQQEAPKNKEGLD